MPTSFQPLDFSIPLRTGYETAFVIETAVGDFNGDGKLDVTFSYFLHPFEDRAVPIRVLAGDGKGGFTDATAQLFGTTPPVTVHGRQIIVADFNKDGRADAFFADHGMDTDPFPGARNALFLSQGTTGLLNAVDRVPNIADFSHSAAAGDVDGDGDIDLFVGNQGSGEKYPYILFNDGTGNFTLNRAGLPTTLHDKDPGISSCALFDADGDGDLDLFLGPWDPRLRAAVILENDGKGNFLKTLTTIPVPGHGTTENVVDAKPIDLNGDGKLDLVINTVVDFQSVGYIRFYINDGKGSFTDETDQRVPARESVNWNPRVQFVDLNGDGKLDMFLSSGSTRPVFLNDGTGRFIQAGADLLPGIDRYDRLYAADVNGDGRSDIISSRGNWEGAEHFRVYLATVPAYETALTTAANSILRMSNAALVSDLANQIASGSSNETAATTAIIRAAGATTSVASLAYEFFTGKLPGLAGMDYLVSPTGPNANNLNSPYYQSFNLENRYINFAVNLGKLGEGKASFQSGYGSLSLVETTQKAYAMIFGSTPDVAKVHAMIDSRADYFAYYGGDGPNGLGTKAALVGWLLAEAQKANLGVMVKANNAWLKDLSDGSAPFGIDILDPSKGYWDASFIY